jgi:carbonic anhydrase/acetyltransferase-like protein (isoleucine patch superfamily)
VKPVPIYALGELVPRIHPDAFIHPEAVIIGDVVIGALSSVWPGAVLRGDDGDIIVGERTSIQDGCVVHTWDEHPTRIGSGCVIGHMAHLEGCHIGDNVLIGSGSILLRRVVVEHDSLVGAGALVPPGKRVPTGAQAVGVPVQIREGRADPEDIADSAAKYVARVSRYKAGLRRID